MNGFTFVTKKVKHFKLTQLSLEQRKALEDLCELFSLIVASLALSIALDLCLRPTRNFGVFCPLVISVESDDCAVGWV